MKRLVKWILLVIFFAALFVYLGGGSLLKDFGKKSVEVGDKLEKVEKKMERAGEKAKDFSKDVSRKAKKKIKKLKEEID